MRREALAEDDETEAAGDTEMADDRYGESISSMRRGSSSSAAAHSSASVPPSSASSTGTLKGASLANLVHDMDVIPATTHEVIEVASESEDDSEDDEDGEQHEGEEVEEVEAVVEPEDDEEDDEDSEDSEEEEDDEGSDDETDVPTATQAPAPPTPPPKISISDLTTNEASAAVAVTVDSKDQGTPVPDALTPVPSATEASAPASKKAKPISVKRKRTPSPSPPPAPPPPPFTTIRLEITLGGPANYEVDIIQMAKDTGQRPASPPPLHAVQILEPEDVPEEPSNGKKRRKVCLVFCTLGARSLYIHRKRTRRKNIMMSTILSSTIQSLLSIKGHMSPRPSSKASMYLVERSLFSRTCTWTRQPL